MLIAAITISQWPSIERLTASAPWSLAARQLAASAAGASLRPPAALLSRGRPPAPSPVGLEIPRISLATRLVPLQLNSDGSIAAPTDPSRAGWLAAGPLPGDRGPAVLVGHLDSDRGPAVFWKLGSLRPGDYVSVSRADGSTVGFLITRLARFPRAEFPSAEVYGPTVGPELRLITCGGLFNFVTRQYRDNLVVFATEAS
jgi:hypothetical protein